MKQANLHLGNILITGCSSGIGLCVAKGLKEAGYRVFATVRKSTDVIKLQNMGFEAWQLDLNDSDSIRQATEAILQACDNNLYALFNNGGFGQPGAVEDLSRQAIREQFETNVFGWIELINLILPSMRANGRGRIIQNSSVLGFAAMPCRGAYNASKYAIEGFSDTLRLELHGSGVYVSLIQPGPISSQFRSNALVKFQQYIDVQKSPHQETYKRTLERLHKKGNNSRFTLGPEAVLDKVLHALQSDKPQNHYRVTLPTHLFYWLKRIFPSRVLDKLLRLVD